jgi:hypothetical protein
VGPADPHWSGGVEPPVKRRTIVIGVLAVMIIGAGAYVGKRLSEGGRVTEVGVERAVDRFREQVASTVAPSTTIAPSGTGSSVPADARVSTSSTISTTTVAAPEHRLPAVGVYAYATIGFDAVDVLNGARHEYPETTTITVTAHGCGVRLRWDVAVQRWDSWDLCLDGTGIRVVAWSGYHEFFGVGGRNDYVCDGDPRPLDASTGTTWEMVCRVGDRDTSTFRGTVLGRPAVVIEGTSVVALHVRYDVDVVGASTGTQTIDGWYRTTDGLPLREAVTVMTAQDTPIGTSNFEEQSTIELVSLTPAS